MYLKNAPYLLAACALVVLSLVPVGAHAPWDKLLHFIVYGGLAMLAYRIAVSDRNYLVTCFCLVCLGGLIELLQAYFPERQASVLDLLANTAGVLIAVMLMYALFGAKMPASDPD